MPKAEPSKANVNRTEPEKGGCPRCNKDVTLEEIKQICINQRGKCVIEDDTMIKAALPYFNKYRKLAGLNTCIRKAHFLAQLAAETKFYDLQEKFKYSNPDRMMAIFSSYFDSFKSLDAKKAETRRLSNLSMNKSNWPIIANTVYSSKNKLSKNHTEQGDGWRYSGKGFHQISLKDTYTSIEEYAIKECELDVKWALNDNPFKLKQNPYDAILSSIVYWKKVGLNGRAVGLSDKDVDNVSALMNKSKSESIIIPRREFFHNAIEVLKVAQCINLSNKKSKNKTYTFDGKYEIKEKELYIDVITPSKRDFEGPMIVLDSNGIVYKTHSLCRGSNRNRLRKAGNGDTPTGKASTSYSPNKHRGNLSYGNNGLIELTGITGEFQRASKNGRAGIAIHAGHTVGYGKFINDQGKLMSTYGCIRIYNSSMKKLTEIYNEYRNKKYKIYCYIEDYSGDINDVYRHYEMKKDPKDSQRTGNSKKQ